MTNHPLLSIILALVFGYALSTFFVYAGPSVAIVLVIPIVWFFVARKKLKDLTNERRVFWITGTNIVMLPVAMLLGFISVLPFESGSDLFGGVVWFFGPLPGTLFWLAWLAFAPYNRRGRTGRPTQPKNPTY